MRLSTLPLIAAALAIGANAHTIVPRRGEGIAGADPTTPDAPAEPKPNKTDSHKPNSKLVTLVAPPPGTVSLTVSLRVRVRCERISLSPHVCVCVRVCVCARVGVRVRGTQAQQDGLAQAELQARDLGRPSPWHSLSPR